jgi:ferredoxin
MASGIPLAEILSKGLPTPVAGFSPDNEKRSLIRQAVNHLAEFSPAPPVEISLPEGAPFGCVVMDKAVCTLCMACVSACPTGALAADGDLPRLYFNENDCHQCGLCLDACPEAALQLRPRLLCSGNDHVSPAVLQETEPFSCIECGTPFTSQAMINRLQNKLAGHWMYRSDRQLRRLRMCRTCSTRDALLAKDFQS